MCLTATKWLSAALDRARDKQKEYGSELLDSRQLRQFPWELYFTLGGLKKSVEISSAGQFLFQLKNQRLSVQTVAAVAHILRKELERRKREPHRRARGLNTAYEPASELVGEANSGEQPSKGSARNYWAALIGSSPLIYAATQVGDGQIFRWLLEDPDRTEFFPEAEDFAVWFNYANEFASTVAGQFQMSALNWQPLAIPSRSGLGLPPAKPRDEFIELLASLPRA
jgi:hypothetical protein